MLNLTTETFHAEREKPGYLLADFWGVWCPPCRSMNPILEKVAEGFPTVTFAKVNATENPDLSAEFQVNAIPAFLLFKDGQLVHRWTGLTSAEQFSQILKDNGVS